MRSAGFIPLFWRLFVPNATVLICACIVLMIEPANGRIPALIGGLGVMLAADLLLMRRAVRPLAQLSALMDTVDLLRPGRRLPPTPLDSEVGVLTNAFNRMLQRLEDERRNSQRRAAVAQEDERRRIAGELHDEIGQQLTALILELDRAARMVDGEAATQLAATGTAARRTLEDVRGLASQLRPEVLDELGLVPALRNLCDRVERHAGMVITRSLPGGSVDVPDDVEMAVYRVVQESLTNVIRHAHAASASVSLSVDEAGLELSVVDDGIGMRGGADGTAGIHGMRERAVAVNGVLDVLPAERGGTEVRLRVALERQEA